MESGHRINRTRSPMRHDAEAVRSARLKAEIKQQDAAAAVGISPSLLSEIEAGTRSPKPFVLAGLAALYEVPVASLEYQPVTCSDTCACACHARESA